jgi:hypothetical protein
LPRLPALLMAWGLAQACRQPADAGPPVVPGLVLCHQAIQVDVNVSQGPRFSWSPGCGATYLEVTSPDRSRVYWAVQGDTGKIAPGVTYGVNPPAFESRFGPFPLEVGTPYMVRVGIMVEEASFAIFGEQSFVR